MKIGAPVWPFQWNPPYEDAIRRIARLGFEAVELIAWNRAALDEYYTSERIAELRRIMDGEGLPLSEFVSTAPHLSSADAAQREASVEQFKRMVDVGVALGATIVNTVSAVPFSLRVPPLLSRPTAQLVTCDVPAEFRSAAAWRENWKIYTEMIQRCCLLCEQAGVRYALEPHPFRWVTDAASMLRLIEQVESSALGINYDPSHTFPCGDLPHVAVYMLGDRIFHCHLSDNDAASNAHWRPGKGKIDWTSFVAALKDVGFDGVLSIELEDVPGVAHKQPSGAATEEFERECVTGMEYIRECIKAAG
jgi:sugar phosphate isomerase/epimerase